MIREYTDGELTNKIMQFIVCLHKKELQAVRSLKQISRGQPRNKGHSKQAIFWWLKN